MDEQVTRLRLGQNWFTTVYIAAYMQGLYTVYSTTVLEYKAVAVLVRPQSTQSDDPVHFLIFCSLSISPLASLVADRRPQCNAGADSWECTLPYLSTGISNLLQPAQAEVVLGQLSTYIFSLLGSGHEQEA